MKRKLRIILVTMLAMAAFAAFACVESYGAQTYNQGDTVSGTFDNLSGKDLATVRYYTDAAKTSYAFADFDYDSGTGKYVYSFAAPYDGFIDETGVSEGTAKIIGTYYSLDKWDGAVDVSWYNETDTNFDLYTPAQLAGLAAVVNGSINTSTPDYMVKGERSVLTVTDGKKNLPDSIANVYYEKTKLIAGVEDEAYKGLVEHDFSNRTVHLKADMDMGGVDGSQINHDANSEKNIYDYPNWTPIGGEYLMDPSDASTMIIASFNGSIDGEGHNITNLYCYRWSYREVAETAYGYAQGTALVGMMGSLAEGEANPNIAPSLKNMSLSGYVYGRRMVGGFVGCLGGGSNAAAGSSVEGGITFENLANHAYVHCTDSKGLGGIVACSMVEAGSVINCYNTGTMDAHYQAPTGGIVGANEGMNIFCCYNTGTIYTNGNSRGRAIGCDSSGRNYTVDDCYYLEGCSDDTKYPGYYTYNLAKSVSVTTTALKAAELSDGTLLNKLNVNGNAYVAGDNGMPVLYWEKNSSLGTGALSLTQTEGGTIAAGKTGQMNNGTVVYFVNEAKSGYAFRYYMLNGEQLSGNYVTVNGPSNEISAYFESAPGILKIVQNKVCTISVKKNGIIINESGESEEVRNYPVQAGDSLYEGDVLKVTVVLKDGAVPDDPNLVYKATQDFAQPYEYTYTYTNVTPKTTSLDTFTVGEEIGAADTSLTLEVNALTTQKMWDYVADTSWYSESGTSFTLNTAAQLAGLSVLVDSGNDFAGKTVKLGRDISLKNNDGTSGKRYWDGIGSYQKKLAFAGSFDGQNYKITDYDGNKNGLFEYCAGTSTARASVKNVSLWGRSEGSNACGIVADARFTDISGCDSYCTVKSTNDNGNVGGILGYAVESCKITNCLNFASLQGKGYVGGIVGQLVSNTSGTSEIKNCFNQGNIYGTNTGSKTGGIVGSLNGHVYESANYGDVKASNGVVGGIAGQSTSAKYSELNGCYNVGLVRYEDGTATADAVGGLIGFASYYNAKNSFNFGPVEKSDAAKTSRIGSVFGNEGRRSTNVTENIYFLDTSCDYVEDSLTLAELIEEIGDPEAGYVAGLNSATNEDFKTAEKVMAGVNGAGVFQLTNGKYPELKKVADLHFHRGGTASCSELATCADCGLKYGRTDASVHVNLKLTDVRDAVWNIDGYTGSTCCADCGKLISKGKTIEADTTKTAMVVYVKKGNAQCEYKTYSIAEFDALKTTSPAIGYAYGGGYSEMMAASEYVTLDDIMSDLGLGASSLIELSVKCTSSNDHISAEVLAECNKYYDEEGKAYDAPAAFAISYNTGRGSLDVVAGDTSINGCLRFGYGISEAQYKAGDSLGGRRMVSPVESITLNIEEGEITLVDGNGGEKLIDSSVMEAGEKTLVTADAPWQCGGDEVYGELYSFSSILDNLGVSASSLHGFKLASADGDINGFQLEEIDDLYLCDLSEVSVNGARGEENSFGMVMKNSSSKKLAADLISIVAEKNHDYIARADKTNHWMGCLVCGDIKNQSAHKWEDKIIEEPTCTKAGSRSVYCSECGKKNEEADPVVKAKGHSYGAWKITETATCTADGEKQRICGVCGDVETATVTKLGHSYGAWKVVKAATCTSDGEKQRACTACGKTESMTVSKLGHDYVSHALKAATTTTNGYTAYKSCSRCDYKTSKSTIYKASKITISATSFTYNGYTQKPKVTVKDSQGNTISSANYDLTNAGGKSVGTYVVKIKFKNRYTGSWSSKFKILPKGTAITSLTAGKSAFTAKWTKQATKMSTSYISGYQLRYSIYTSMASAKTVKITSYKTVSKAVTGLKAKKKYYVQIRTYKTVNGVTYYSGWSARKAVLTK